MDHFNYKKISSSFKSLFFRVNPFWIHLSYFMILTSVGFLALKFSEPKESTSRIIKLKGLDLFFTSVSAGTVSSMATIEMENFSNIQLVVLTFLMLFGGEVFTSMLDLQLLKFKFAVDNNNNNNKPRDELVEVGTTSSISSDRDEEDKLRINCIRTLATVVLGYLVVVHVANITLVAVYISHVQSAREVLEKKGLNLQIFSIFTMVSTFSNCGFVPTNENMMVFKKNPGLLLILIPQILMGNTMYPTFLYWVIWITHRITNQKRFGNLIKNPSVSGYDHLLPRRHCLCLAATVVWFILVQFAVFCSLEWQSEATSGLNGYEKVVAILFQVVNSRHTGESVFDLSLIAPAMSVLFIVMMYLPPYTTFLPFGEAKNVRDEKKNEKQDINYLECVVFSQVTYLLISVILICITEREKMKEDPLNFNVLNVVLEVVSAYGNVGFSAGYSCARQIKPNGDCKDAWYGFVGRWSNNGKIILILVMFFGRLKKFSMRGGKAWKLS